MNKYLLMFMIFSSSFILGQKNYILTLTDESYQQFKKNIPQKFTDSIQAKKYLTNLQLTAISKGYLVASIDSIHYLPKELRASFHLGPKFGKVNLRMKDEDLIYFRRYMHVHEKFFTSIAFTPKQLSGTLKQMQMTLENNGYPFGKIFLDSIEFEDQNLRAHIHVEKNQQFKWTEVHIKGDSALSKIFLSNIIRIKPGDLYNQDDLRQITKRLKQINFIKEIKNHEVLFTKNGVELFLYIKSNPISSVNGVVGLQPNAVTNKLSLTGELSLKLLNAIKRGELLEFNWKSIQEQTQSLKGKVNYPFILKTPFGIDAQFNLYKRDTSFVELKSTLGIQYFLKGGNYFKFFYQISSSNILSGGANNPQLVHLGTVKSNSYGLALLRRQVDYIPNPSRGFIFNSEFAIGNRKSRHLDSTEFQISNTFRSDVHLELFFPVAKRHILRLANQTELYYAPTIYQNEVYRFGGQTTQRGFNEEELFATTKSLLSIEYRFLVDQNSRAFLFYDQSWYENNATNKYYNDTPMGFGVGYSFGSNIGIFSISYALGKQMGNPILMKDGKVHFGYVAYF